MNSGRIIIRKFESCTSTNDEAWAIVESASWGGQPLIVTTNHQTKGRGRQGRSWSSSQTGNIYASLLCKPPQKNIQWAPLIAGIAVIKTINQTFGLNPSSLRLKWPNDIMIDDKKTGGILCESRFLEDRCIAMVIGLGLNVLYTPSDTSIPASSLSQAFPLPQPFQFEIFRDDFLKVWTLHFLQNLALAECGQTSEVASQWESYAQLARYSRLSTHGPDGNLYNVSPLGLDQQGRLKALWNSKEVYLDQADSFRFN